MIKCAHMTCHQCSDSEAIKLRAEVERLTKELAEVRAERDEMRRHAEFIRRLTPNGIYSFVPAYEDEARRLTLERDSAQENAARLKEENERLRKEAVYAANAASTRLDTERDFFKSQFFRITRILIDAVTACGCRKGSDEYCDRCHFLISGKHK